MRKSTRLAAALTLASIAPTTGNLPAQLAPRPAPRYDILLRGGTVVDGSGAPRFVADIGITGGRIARIGNLAGAHAPTELDVGGLMVAPGFINIHSHASPAALPTAVNMLTQGVTTELLNADGGGPTDLAVQLEPIGRAGLALNVGASIGFNSIWQSVMGPSNRRPTSIDVEKMQTLILRGLEHGAFGVSAGLDYKPAYFATTDEVVEILKPAGGGGPSSPTTIGRPLKTVTAPGPAPSVSPTPGPRPRFGQWRSEPSRPVPGGPQSPVGRESTPPAMNGHSR